MSWESTKLAGHSRALFSGLSLRAANESSGRPHLQASPAPWSRPGAGRPQGRAFRPGLWSSLHSALQLCLPHLLSPFFHLQMKTFISQGPAGGAALKRPCQGPGGVNPRITEKSGSCWTHSIWPRNSYSPATWQLTALVPAQ